MDITSDTDRGQGFSELEMTRPVICDGCNVRDPWEHRCHGRLTRHRGTVVACECKACREHEQAEPRGIYCGLCRRHHYGSC